MGITFVFVTHDQGEALEMSDRLAVMDGGRVVQCGAPRDVYDRPEAEFVADFLGVANLFDVDCKESVGPYRRVLLGSVPVQASSPAGFADGPGRAVVRPEAVRLADVGESGEGRLPGLVERTVFQGSTTLVHVRLVHGPSMQVLVTHAHGVEAPKEGSPGTVVLPPGALRVLTRSAPAASQEEPVAKAG